MTLFDQLSEALRQTRFHAEWLDKPFYADDHPLEKPKSKRVVRLDSGEPPPKDSPAKAASLPVKLHMDKFRAMSLPEVVAAAQQIIREASPPQVERLKKQLAAKAEYSRKQAALEDSEVSKAKCMALSERLNEIHISLCFAEKQAFEPQAGGRGKTRSDRERVLRGSKERHCLKGIETEAHLEAAIQSLKDKERPVSLHGLGEFRKENEMRARIEAARKRKPSPAEKAKLKNFKIHHLPIAELEKEMEPESVDTIFTDPPYRGKDIPVFKDLGRFAGKVLKPGGSLISLCGDMFLPRVISLISECKELKWEALLHYIYTGPTPRPIGRLHVFVSGKPVLWFQKGKYRGPSLNNVIYREGIHQAEDHHWGQSVPGMQDILRRFQPGGKVVCDPFIGGGALAEAAFNLDCGQFIGGDCDLECVETARGRLAEAARGRLATKKRKRK